MIKIDRKHLVAVVEMFSAFATNPKLACACVFGVGGLVGGWVVGWGGGVVGWGVGLGVVGVRGFCFNISTVSEEHPFSVESERYYPCAVNISNINFTNENVNVPIHTASDQTQR